MKSPPEKILIIQTAFLGDVVLATAAVESIHAALPAADIHFLLRKGNESLLEGAPVLKRLWILDKKNKWKNTWRMVRELRKEEFDVVINFQRFMTSGLLSALSGGKDIRGFSKNPLSVFFDKRFDHIISPKGSDHEIERNHLLYNDLAPDLKKPKLYPQDKHLKELPEITGTFICLAPASVWFTKQLPASKWTNFLNLISEKLTVYMLGAPGDKKIVEKIISGTKNTDLDLVDLTGKLSLLGSAALMKKAQMNYVNDSAPLHLASAVNAPVSAIFCSTIPEFGFTPLSDDSQVIQLSETLACRPCGLHGHRECPEGHFKCALDIDTSKLLNRLEWRK